ncbi:MAG: hypothetical protein A2V98_23525 [Planctomycetes bacterium RBG_16_64_12]|nr:MAG: hypothetical protein A2V98_23525 [Planctomycetes bacterium RBG_16_64_12]
MVVSILLGASSVVAAEAQTSRSTGPQPVLTVSLSGFRAIKKDLQSLAQASGTPQLMMPLMMLGPQGPAGLDATKPWGAVVQADGQQFVMYAFLPVTDIGQLLGSLKAFAPNAELPEPDAEGVYEFEMPDRKLVLAEKGGWAFLADSRETLANVPKDPVPLLGGLNESYAVAVRATVKNVPESMRQNVLGPLQMGLAMGQQQLPEESDEQYAIRKKMMARSMEEFTKLVNETDSLMIGLAVDPQSNALRLDVETTAMEGTDSAAEYASLGEAKSNLAGFFLPEAAMTALFAGTMPESDAAQLTDVIDTLGSKALADLDDQDLSDNERKLAKQVLGDLIDVIRATVESRRIDAAFAALASADSLNLVAGGFVADAAKLEKLFKQMVHIGLAEDPGMEQAITLDAEEHQGVRLHTVSIPADALPGDDLPAMIVGENLTAAVGFSDQAAYLAIGPQSIDTLKQAIDQSKAAADQPVPPFRFSLSASAIGRVAEGVGAAEQSEMAPEIIDAMKQAGENDHLSVVFKAIPSGMRTSVELEVGVLKVIGAAAGAVMQEMGPGGALEFQGFGREEAPRPPGGVPAQP